MHARGGIYRDTEDNVIVILESVETTRNQGPPFFCRPTSGNIRTSSERERERIGFSRVRGGIVWNPWRKISLDKDRFDSIRLVEGETTRPRYRALMAPIEIIIFESCRGNIVSIDVSLFLSLFFLLLSSIIMIEIPIVVSSSAQIRITITKRHDHYG